MTTLASILAAHGINPDTISTTGPATRLGEELERWASEREMIAHVDGQTSVYEFEGAATARAWARAEAAEARHRRHLLRLRWRRDNRTWKVEALKERIISRASWKRAFGGWNLGAELRANNPRPIAGPFPGDDKREPGRLP